MKGPYTKAFIWFLLHVTISAVNDTLVKKLVSEIPVFEIVFLRYLFSTVLLLPHFIKINSFKPKNKFIFIHSLRGLILFCSITIWSICLKHTSIVNVTLMSFTIPIFLVILAKIFLDEKIGIHRLIIISVGFIGIIIIINPFNINLNSYSILLLIGAILFSSLDILNKKIVLQENKINMIFYSSLFTMAYSIIALKTTTLVTPTISDIFILFLLGAGSNLMLYTILKAFTLVDASSLAPIRYIEVLITGFFGYVFFDETPSTHFFIGAVIILVCNMYLIKTECKKD